MCRVLKCGGTNQKISVSLVQSAFDLQDLIEIDHGYYCLANDNAIQATKDIIHLNQFSDDACDVCPEFPGYHMDIKDLKFAYNPDVSTRDYVILKVEPLTPTGKQPKYPIVLLYDDYRIFYGQDKKVQKVRIIVWKDILCYELDLALHSGELAVHFIYRTSVMDSIKTKLYEHPKD